MRGLYILLMFHQNTDFKNFLMMLPYDLHKTAEVKLAIEVVISLRHRDYAKFFKVLRSRCGYIYSCVVFKVCHQVICKLCEKSQFLSFNWSLINLYSPLKPEFDRLN